MKLAKNLTIAVFGILMLGLGACGPTSSIPHYYKGDFQNHPQIGNQELS
ncbi:MAG: hypothetical protein HQL69_18270, partial [Magnetococcales bacterium]|nr:hypothetical protein [Magnetococcales bacterium]